MTDENNSKIRNKMKERDFDTILSTAVHLYNILPEKINFVGKSDNIVYEYSSRDTLYILRFTHSSHRTTKAVKGEIDFLNYLVNNSRKYPSGYPGHC